MKRARQESENSDWWPGFDSEDEDSGNQVTSTTNCIDVAPEEDANKPPPPECWVSQEDRRLFKTVQQDAERRAISDRNNPFIKNRPSLQPTASAAATATTQPTSDGQGEAYWKQRCLELEREAQLRASQAAAAVETRAPTPLQFAGSEGDASPSASRSRAVDSGCSCTNFACLLVPGAYNNLDYWAWCKSHGLFNPKCVDHGSDHLKEDGRKWVCQCRLEDGSYCRKVAPPMNPPVNPMHLFKALDVLANGASIGKTCNARIAKLLRIVKVYWGMTPEITLDETATEEVPRKKSKAPEVKEPAEEEPEEGGSASASDEEEPEEEAPEEEAPEEEPGLMYGVLRAQDVLPSLGDGKVIYCQGIRIVLKQHQIVFVDQGQKDWGSECGHLPRGLAKADKVGVIMCHNDHWFSGVADSNHLKLYVSDSDKHFKKEDREICVGEWCKWFQTLWGSKTQVVSVNRSSVEQQAKDSNDGGIHAIRNVLRELRCAEAPVYTRAVIKKTLKHKQTQEKEEAAWKAERDAKEAARKKPASKKGGKKK